MIPRAALRIPAGWRCLPACCFALLALPAHAVEPTAGDFGGVGLWQTPSARMMDTGELTFHFSRTDPYSRYNLMLQPFDWLEAGFRYIDVSNRLYGSNIAGGQSYKDKGIDAKFRLWKESRHLPEVALGFRDIGGTGLFAGEFLVGSKRVGDFDFSLGMGWGYLGASDNLGNPLGLVWDGADERPGISNISDTGDINFNQFFRGPTSLFAGVQYQRAGSPFIFKAEYEGNDYQSEPQSNNQEQDSPVNLGVVWRARPFMDVQVALERGNTAMVGLTFHTNLARARPQPRRYDPAPEPVRVDAPAPAREPLTEDSLRALVPELERQGGLTVTAVSLRQDEVVVAAENNRYRHTAEAADRVARVLDNRLPAHVRWFTLQSEQRGLRQMDATVDRSLWRRTHSEPTTPAEQAGAMQADPPAYRLPAQDLVRAEVPRKPWSGGLGVGYKQSLGGPDGFFLYQLSLMADAEWRFSPGFWFSGTASYRFFDNYDDFKYTGPSLLPRVRTYMREYLTTSELTLPVAQLTAVREAGQDLYVMGYGGLLESMFAGVGGEILYRPFGRGVALGFDLNYVQQRDFEQDLGLRDYRVLTGHASLYWRTGWQDVLATVKAGRYLAKDIGVTVDLSRQFSNGVTMGAYATLTDAGKDFGEGSFDKGIYVRVPFDLFMPKATRSVANMNWNPLTRDGGAVLARRYGLYQLTQDRDPALFRRPSSGTDTK